MAAAFLYCVCQVGAEAALKREVSARRPELRPAFARPGLVTFKAEGAAVDADQDPGSPLVRAWGASLGPATDLEAVFRALRGACPKGQAIRLQVFERDRWRPGEEPAGFAYGAAAAELRARLVAAWPEDLALAEGEAAAAGEWIADVILGEEGEPWLVGHHRHVGRRSAHPGGRIPVAEAPEAPSRAYYKLEEAIAWSAAPLRAGDVAVELGSAPGGASYALLRRGLAVHGIDPGAMDPRVLAFAGPEGPRFTHHACTMGQVQRSDLPRDLHWLISDVNLAPQIALQTLRRLGARPRRALLGVLCTLKLDDWKALRHLPGWLRQIEAMGMIEVAVTQLPRNRMELFAYGLTAAGVARRGRPAVAAAAP